MARTTNSDALPFVESRYELSMLASQRVRDLNGGAEPVVDKRRDKLTVVSLREIASGKLDVDNLRHEFIQSYKETSFLPVNDDSLSDTDISLEVKAEDPMLREIDAELGGELVSEPVAEEKDDKKSEKLEETSDVTAE